MFFQSFTKYSKLYNIQTNKHKRKMLILGLFIKILCIFKLDKIICLSDV